MSRLFSKRAIILALAVAVAAGLFAASANAAGPGWAPGENALFLYTNTNLSTPFYQDFEISEEWEWVALGVNAIQEYVHIEDTNDDFYAITTHPQYIGATGDFDDQINAEYVMQITGLKVWDPEVSDYVDCFETGFGIIPAAYAVMSPTARYDGYFPCEISANIINLATGEVTLANWTDDDPRTIIYLAIPPEVDQ